MPEAFFDCDPDLIGPIIGAGGQNIHRYVTSQLQEFSRITGIYEEGRFHILCQTTHGIEKAKMLLQESMDFFERQRVNRSQRASPAPQNAPVLPPIPNTAVVAATPSWFDPQRGGVLQVAAPQGFGQQSQQPPPHPQGRHVFQLASAPLVAATQGYAQPQHPAPQQVFQLAPSAATQQPAAYQVPIAPAPTTNIAPPPTEAQMRAMAIQQQPPPTLAQPSEAQLRAMAIQQQPPTPVPVVVESEVPRFAEVSCNPAMAGRLDFFSITDSIPGSRIEYNNTREKFLVFALTKEDVAHAANALAALIYSQPGIQHFAPKDESALFVRPFLIGYNGAGIRNIMRQVGDNCVINPTTSESGGKVEFWIQADSQEAADAALRQLQAREAKFEVKAADVVECDVSLVPQVVGSGGSSIARIQTDVGRNTMIQYDNAAGHFVILSDADTAVHEAKTRLFDWITSFGAMPSGASSFGSPTFRPEAGEATQEVVETAGGSGPDSARLTNPPATPTPPPVGTSVKRKKQQTPPPATHLDNDFTMVTCFRQRLGQGVSGDVFPGTDMRLNRKVAVKVFRAPKVEDGNTLQRMCDDFEHEYETLRGFDHKNVINVIHYCVDSTTDERRIYMELMLGGTLESLIQKTSQGLTAPLLQHYFRSALEGLAYVWDKGVVHRDIKPLNMLLDTPKGLGGTCRAGHTMKPAVDTLPRCNECNAMGIERIQNNWYLSLRCEQCDFNVCMSCSGKSSEPGMLKLADFGTCVNAPPNGTEDGFVRPDTEHGGTVPQSLCYVAPEIASPHDGRQYSHQSDLWALACSVLQMGSRRHPWTQADGSLDPSIRKHGTTAQSLRQHILEAESRVESGEHHPTIPADFEDKFGAELVKLLKVLFSFAPKERGEAADALRHDYFKKPCPLPRPQPVPPLRRQPAAADVQVQREPDGFGPV